MKPFPKPYPTNSIEWNWIDHLNGNYLGGGGFGVGGGAFNAYWHRTSSEYWDRQHYGEFYDWVMSPEGGRSALNIPGEYSSYQVGHSFSLGY
jgi:hypothetical protein